MLPEYRPEPFTDFSIKANAKAMQAALEHVKEELGKSYTLVIGGQHIELTETFDSTNPSDPSQVIGRFGMGTVDHVNQAISAAGKAFKTWSKVPGHERARYLLRAAAAMRRQKFEFAAWMVYEVSKSWAEADGDVAEAIDFLEYYARQMMRLDGAHDVLDYAGEENEMRYIPLGIGAVIPPWNFPLAIMAGMTAAAIVTGNTVVLKPAESAPTIAARFMRLMIEEAALPDGVVNFITGPGGVIGDALVDHPQTRFIAFTGSKDIGKRIYERASKVHEGQLWLKRTILEMGGKDAIIVDETADLHAAADGITAAAFGFQGQKCSACSRAIIVDSVYDTVLKKVVERTKKLTQGDPTDQGNFMGAVIDPKAFKKIKSYIEIGKDEGRLVLGGETGAEADGYFVPPTIFADIDGDARVAQEEIFGPVVAFVRARDWEHALEIANSTEFGLTGAVFSRSRERLEQARHEFHVGNLYLNRKCTGALVGVQPFGGFNMSGTDSKAGGPDYLQLFMQAKSITERF